MNTGDSARLLHIEDDDDHADLFATALHRCATSCKIERIPSGTAALEQLRHWSTANLSERPNVVLLDLNLPGVDGFEVLKWMKSDPKLGSIPVVILTTSDSSVDREKAYRLHANSYLLKPSDFAGWCTLVEEVVTYWSRMNRSAP